MSRTEKVAAVLERCLDVLSKTTGWGREREIAQSVKCLLHIHEPLRLISRTQVGKPDVLAGTCNPSNGEARAGSSLGVYWPANLAEYKNDSIPRNDNQG